MAELERKSLLLIGEPELLCFRKNRSHIGRGRAGPHQGYGLVEVVAAALVRVDKRLGCAPDRECAVVARAVAVERMEDVEVGGITRPQGAVREVVWVRAAPLAGDGVDAFDVL